MDRGGQARMNRGGQRRRTRGDRRRMTRAAQRRAVEQDSIANVRSNEDDTQQNRRSRDVDLRPLQPQNGSGRDNVEPQHESSAAIGLENGGVGVDVEPRRENASLFQTQNRSGGDHIESQRGGNFAREPGNGSGGDYIELGREVGFTRAPVSGTDGEGAQPQHENLVTEMDADEDEPHHRITFTLQPQNYGEQRNFVAQTVTDHVETGPQQEVVDDDEQVTRNRDGGSEPQNESLGGAVPQTVQSDVLNPRKRKSNLGEGDEHDAEPDAHKSEVPDQCTICFEPLWSTGDHRVCCLACGHLFGLSCINYWLRKCGKRKCPQCLKRADKKDIRLLYPPRVVVADSQVLEEKLILKSDIAKLKTENLDLRRELQAAQKELALRVASARGVSSNTAFYNQASVNGHTIGDVRNIPNGLVDSGEPLSGINSRFISTAGDSQNASVQEHIAEEPRLQSGIRANTNGKVFYEQIRVPLNGSKAFDMDAYTQTLLFSNKFGNNGSGFGLCKMSLLDSTVIEKVHFQSDSGAIRDIRIAGPENPGNLALVASIKKLSVLSLESNGVVLSYDLPSPAWSCAWDPTNSTLLYSGLQNGSVLVFDIRRTTSPMMTLDGPVAPFRESFSRPVHSLQVIPKQTSQLLPGWARATLEFGQFGDHQILGASVIGVFSWDLSSSGVDANSVSRPSWIFTATEKSCSSLVYDKSSDIAVASIRPSPTSRPTSSNLIPRDGIPMSSHALSQGTGHNFGASQGLSYPSTGSGQLADPLATMCAPSTQAINRDYSSHWMLRRNHAGSSDLEPQASSFGSTVLPWRWVGEMTGHRSQTFLSRGAIIPRSSRSPLFASGDELSQTVWLWDMESSRVFQSLNPHESAVLDVRTIQIQDVDLVGSLSDKSFHLYRKNRE